MKAGQEQFVKNLEQALTLDAAPRPLQDKARLATTEELPSWFRALNPGGDGDEGELSIRPAPASTLTERCSDRRGGETFAVF